MAAQYRKGDGCALFRLRACVAGIALVLISAIIPWAVFTRYVLNSAASWPETAAVLLTIVLTFFGAAACYRLGLHMNVTLGVDLLPARAPRCGFRSSRLLMAVMATVHAGLRRQAVRGDLATTRSPNSHSCRSASSIRRFQSAALITLLFIIEHLTIGRPAGRGRSAPRATLPVERSTWTSSFSSGRCSCASGSACRFPIRSASARSPAPVDRHSAGSGDAEDLRRRQQGGDAHHSVLRAGRRHHGGRRHGAAPGRLRQCHRRHGARARRSVGGEHHRHHVPERHFRLLGRRHLGDRLGA